MNTGRGSSLDHARRGENVPEGKGVLGHEIGPQNLPIEELAKIYLMCLAAMQPQQPTVEHKDPSPKKKASRGRYFLEICFDWKFAVVVEVFAVWALKSFVMPLLK